MSTILLEILPIDHQAVSTPSFQFPEISFEETIMPWLMLAIAAIIFIFFARLLFFLFKLKMAGPDEEIFEAAKTNIKRSLVFLLISSLSWFVLSVINQGIVIEF